MAYKIKQKKKFVSTGGYRGYYQSPYAVLGSSDTGTFSDSPAPSFEVKKELKDFQAFLKKKGIKSQIKTTQSSNVFMAKRWVTVNPSDYGKAKGLAKEYLKNKEGETNYIHGTD